MSPGFNIADYLGKSNSLYYLFIVLNLLNILYIELLVNLTMYALNHDSNNEQDDDDGVDVDGVFSAHSPPVTSAEKRPILRNRVSIYDIQDLEYTGCHPA